MVDRVTVQPRLWRLVSGHLEVGAVTLQGVHVQAGGQGERFADLVRAYKPEEHPIVGPLLRGGPAELARAYGVPHEEGYVDECHFCYVVRKALLSRFPEYLAPRQIYGLNSL